MLLLDVPLKCNLLFHCCCIFTTFEKKLTDQIIICLVFILVLNDLNALSIDSQNTKVFTTTESATQSAFLNLQPEVSIMLIN